MKFIIYAKILGSFLPTKKVRIYDCVIEKHISPHLTEDSEIIQIPVKEESMMVHNISSGLRNFIQYSQKPISTRNFQSEYTIKTEVKGWNLYDVIRTAEDRFDMVTATLSLALKTTIRKAGEKRLKRIDEYYDYELASLYIRKNKQLIKVKMPQPLLNSHNIFPNEFPKGFVHKAKRFIQCTDSIFFKGLSYIHKATILRDNGNYNELLMILNLVKTIELISNSLGIKTKYLDKKTNKKRKVPTEKIFELAGKKLKVTNNSIKIAKKGWDVRCNADIAHSIGSHTFPGISHSQLDYAANEYLIKYYKYIIKNKTGSIVLGGKAGWRMAGRKSLI